MFLLGYKLPELFCSSPLNPLTQKDQGGEALRLVSLRLAWNPAVSPYFTVDPQPEFGFLRCGHTRPCLVTVGQSGSRGLRRKWNQQGVSWSDAFPPGILEANQVHDAPNNIAPFLPPRTGDVQRVSPSQESPAWLCDLWPLCGARTGDGGDPRS